VGLYMLRAYEIGLNIEELTHLTMGEFMDLLVERGNDNEEWPELPTADDFKRFM